MIENQKELNELVKFISNSIRAIKGVENLKWVYHYSSINGLKPGKFDDGNISEVDWQEVINAIGVDKVDQIKNQFRDLLLAEMHKVLRDSENELSKYKIEKS